MIDKQRVGKIGETAASNYLFSKGYQIKHRNFRAKQYGEVDIMAIHPNGNTLVFVEVKTRIGNEFGRPEEAATSAKLHEIRKMVDYYYNLYPQTKLPPQIDVVAVTLNGDETVSIVEHFENVTL